MRGEAARLKEKKASSVVCERVRLLFAVVVVVAFGSELAMPSPSEVVENSGDQDAFANHTDACGPVWPQHVTEP